jgi:(R,R)-butanediol dehydrogenase / meso-butanediol dehydrogenase / diacetyl reductase
VRKKVVEAIGAGVTSVKAGDRVSVQPLIMPRVGDYYAERGLLHLSSELANGEGWRNMRQQIKILIDLAG